jgi:hypothetical protein
MKPRGAKKYAYVEEPGMRGKDWVIGVSMILVILFLCWFVKDIGPVTDRDLCELYRSRLRDKPRIMWTPNEIAKLTQYCTAVAIAEDGRR